MIEPGPGAPDTPTENLLAERNAFLESLAVEAKERFLDTLVAAKERGLSDDAAWGEAVVAAETTYAPDEAGLADTLPPAPGEVIEEEP
jgi:hypothetical protein